MYQIWNGEFHPFWKYMGTKIRSIYYMLASIFHGQSVYQIINAQLHLFQKYRQAQKWPKFLQANWPFCGN